MADKFNYLLLNIADKVRDSILNRQLHIDYPKILEYCRIRKISSYTLDLIIRKELDILKMDDAILYPPPQMMEKIVPIEAKVEGEQAQRENTPPIEKIKPKKRMRKKRLSLLLKVLGIIIWFCVTTGLIITLIITRKDLESKNEGLYQIHDAAITIANAFNKISPTQISDWTSSNTGHFSEDKISIPLYVEAGDELKGEAWVDSEYIHDYLEVSIGREGIYPERLCKISGHDAQYEIKYKFNSDGLYSLYIRYRKDGSFSYNADQGGVRNLKLVRKINESLEVFKFDTYLE